MPVSFFFLFQQPIERGSDDDVRISLHGIDVVDMETGKPVERQAKFRGERLSLPVYISTDFPVSVFTKQSLLGLPQYGVHFVEQDTFLFALLATQGTRKYLVLQNALSLA